MKPGRLAALLLHALLSLCSLSIVGSSVSGAMYILSPNRYIFSFFGGFFPHRLSD
jgi:hypothetical protein